MPHTTESLTRQLQAEYSDYYKTSVSDSPTESRRFLAQEVLVKVLELLDNQKRVRILDLGAGRQIFEAELQANPVFDTISGRVDIITIDFAEIEKEQLLATDLLHLQASGTNIPIISNYFDLVISSSAMDFMPRETFAEAHRVLKPNGILLATLHHPSLIEIAETNLEDVRQFVRKTNQKVLHGRASKKWEVYQKKHELALRQLQDVLFIIEQLPQLIFSSLDDVQAVLSATNLQPIKVTEVMKSANNDNGWFFAEAQKSAN